MSNAQGINDQDINCGELMKSEIKDLWVQALKSGEFEQTTGQLCKDEAYCALGVLSVLALIHGQCTYDEREDGGRFDNRAIGLSYNIMNWAGIEDFLVAGKEFLPFIYEDKVVSISILNDAGLTFDEIAEEIEKHWEEF